jgi:hypothetical protein
LTSVPAPDPPDASGATEPADDDVITDDLANAELIESAGLQNAVAVTGPGALLMVPVAWALAAVRRLLRRR